MATGNISAELPWFGVARAVARDATGEVCVATDHRLESTRRTTDVSLSATTAVCAPEADPSTLASAPHASAVAGTAAGLSRRPGFVEGGGRGVVGDWGGAGVGGWVCDCEKQAEAAGDVITAVSGWAQACGPEEGAAKAAALTAVRGWGAAALTAICGRVGGSEGLDADGAGLSAVGCAWDGSGSGGGGGGGGGGDDPAESAAVAACGWVAVVGGGGGGGEGEGASHDALEAAASATREVCRSPSAATTAGTAALVAVAAVVAASVVGAGVP